MVGESGDDLQARRQGRGGHRAVPHTADVRVEAWGTSREQCLAEAVLGLVESFADLSRAGPGALRRVRVARDSDEDVLAALLEEVVFRLEVHGEVPVEAEARTVEDGAVEARLAVTDLSAVPVTGAAPKAVSWHGLRMGPDPYGWSCAATVDV
ncbi:archease [Streptomyces albus subsp. chlorinus]|uniref:archease n=1 Tax=Streptomyces albus TaxID=1888 RepID=UPI00156ED796|nr:archease [Streptomyces albus]NSC25279.1 archease [Streptomyces albus subsp. chlorinus]